MARFFLRFATKAPLRVERRGAFGAVEKPFGQLRKLRIRLWRGSFSALLRKRPCGSSGEARWAVEKVENAPSARLRRGLSDESALRAERRRRIEQPERALNAAKQH